MILEEENVIGVRRDAAILMQRGNPLDFGQPPFQMGRIGLTPLQVLGIAP
jgi:hypothetical protein